jgi:hypothetical protein
MPAVNNCWPNGKAQASRRASWRSTGAGPSIMTTAQVLSERAGALGFLPCHGLLYEMEGGAGVSIRTQDHRERALRPLARPKRRPGGGERCSPPAWSLRLPR